MKDFGGKQAHQSGLDVKDRVSTFLLDWSILLKKRGHAANPVVPTKSPQDLVDYLTLVPETVARVFRHFQNDGQIQLDRRHSGCRSTEPSLGRACPNSYTE